MAVVVVQIEELQRTQAVVQKDIDNARCQRTLVLEQRSTKMTQLKVINRCQIVFLHSNSCYMSLCAVCLGSRSTLHLAKASFELQQA